MDSSQLDASISQGFDVEELIRSYQEGRMDVYEAKYALRKEETIDQLKEKDRLQIVAEQEGLVKSILRFKKLLNDRIQSADSRSEYFKEVIQALSKSPGSSSTSYKDFGISQEAYSALLEYGRELLKKTTKEDAVHLFTILTFLDYNSFEAWTGLAIAYLFNEKTDESISCAWKAHLINPKNAAPLECLLSCYERQKNWDKASQILDCFRSVKDDLNPSTRKLLSKHSKYISKFTNSKGGQK